jgi:hypothetical protein
MLKKSSWLRAVFENRRTIRRLFKEGLTRWMRPGNSANRVHLTSQRPTSAAKLTLEQISQRIVDDPRLASPIREIWGIPQCAAAFADLERSADAVQHVDLFKL